MYGAYLGATGRICCDEKADDDLCTHGKACRAAPIQAQGIGRALTDFVLKWQSSGEERVSIGLINKNRVLKNWYISCGFVETGTRMFSHLPFEVCFMEKAVSRELCHLFEVCFLGQETK